ncbi:putative NADH-flavin reductase [Paenibacillus sp. V4I3]|uniref:NAD(P)-dependent oxidoreductase n=1 Tax=unclassified Paenibacillus TaxID=185978 RepID=UPI00278653E1|nr:MULTISPECIES: SDR family oxidoreductase [unclassified Paenibacillus]MDQ0872509.1 putative NADH-flavin reductase [Paenibacillus sp. V4I3]MDQ0891606.1 putative NADH-flavin reductase [Paenibacillus sp. V4I9]
MHILILGATGRVGRRIFEKALANGHEVTALVRSIEKLPGIHSEGLTMLQGDARNGEDLHAALRGAELVISCLGTDGGTVLTEFTPLLIEAMKTHGVSRIVTVGTAGILQSREHPGLLRYETPDSRRSSTRAAEEHRKAWEQLAASGLSWTVVCPTYLPDGEPQGQYRIERDYLPEGGMSVSVGDTAAFTYRAALEGEYVGCRVGIAY